MPDAQKELTHHDLHLMLVRMEGKQDALLDKFSEHRVTTAAQLGDHAERITTLETHRTWLAGITVALAAVAGWLGIKFPV